jgi:hypothetical protein
MLEVPLYDYQVYTLNINCLKCRPDPTDDPTDKAFGEDPPSVANLAIMNDSDNTGESAVSYIDYIEIYR